MSPEMSKKNDMTIIPAEQYELRCANIKRAYKAIAVATAKRPRTSGASNCPSPYNKYYFARKLVNRQCHKIFCFRFFS